MREVGQNSSLSQPGLEAWLRKTKGDNYTHVKRPELKGAKDLTRFTCC